MSCALERVKTNLDHSVNPFKKTSKPEPIFNAVKMFFLACLNVFKTY